MLQRVFLFPLRAPASGGAKKIQLLKGAPMKKTAAALALVVLLTAQSNAWKAAAHFVSLPLIEGAGIYASVKTLSDADGAPAKAAAIANLAVLGANAAVGVTAMVMKDESRERLTKIHRIGGFVVTASALALSIATSTDANTRDGPVRFVSYGYTAFTVVPLIVFAF
jgi:hypothetical protein